MRDLTAAVRRAFEPGAGTHRIGAEVEMFVLGPGRTPAPLFEGTGVAGLPAGAVTSTEPGGQIEVSLAPRPSAELLATDVAQAVRAVTRSARLRSAGVHLAGVHPFLDLADVPLVLRTPRYLAMQDLFDRTGPAGRRMMRLTASLQVCVDRLPGAAGIEQWLVANLAGPALVAAFCPSGERTAIWRAIDRARTAYDGRHLDVDDPVGAYLAFAAAAERLDVAESRDPDYHLGTLFPPVRPRRGYLELRFLDAQPVVRVPEVLATISTLLLDPDVRGAALDLLLPTVGDLEARWAAAERGESPEAGDLLALATPLDVPA